MWVPSSNPNGDYGWSSTWEDDRDNFNDFVDKSGYKGDIYGYGAGVEAGYGLGGYGDSGYGPTYGPTYGPGTYGKRQSADYELVKGVNEVSPDVSPEYLKRIEQTIDLIKNCTFDKNIYGGDTSLIKNFVQADCGINETDLAIAMVYTQESFFTKTLELSSLKLRNWKSDRQIII